jgi:hypothetical protein
MILYHFTHRGHLPTILEQGRLKVVESNVSITKDHAGPDVVWLFDTPEVPPTTTDGSLYAAKRQVRFTVSIPKQHVHRWVKWPPVKGMDPDWKAAFVRAGGGVDAARHWWVATSPIPYRQWVEVTVNGEPLDLKGEAPWVGWSV